MSSTTNADDDSEEVIALVRRVIDDLRGNTKHCNKDDGIIDTCESEVSVNALVGPQRTYMGKKTDQNDFFIDSGRVSIDKYNAKDRPTVERIRSERALREEREAQEEMSESVGSTQAIKAVIAKVDPLGLGAIRNRLTDPTSPIAKLFLEARLKNLTDFLTQFNKRRDSIIETRRSRPQRAPSAEAKSGSDDDVLKHEIQFEDSILARINFLEAEILAEFASVNYEGHLPSSQTGKRPRGDEIPRPISRRTQAVADAERIIIDRMIRAIDEVNRLVGLVALKRNLARLIVSAIVQINVAGLFETHKNIMLFGQPGTGKTTIAARASDVLRAMGIIPERPVFNATIQTNDRSTLVSGFEGQTAIKTRQQFARYYGSVFFIDEVYTLHQGERDETGNEAVDAIVKFTEDFKGEVLIICAGYEDLIRKRILNTNEGFSSRFPYKWRLPNYSAQQLVYLTLPDTTAASTALFATYIPFNGDGIARLITLPIGVRTAGEGGSIIGPTRDILIELIGRAWEKNLFEDTNARGSINLRRTIDEVRAQRLFVEAEESESIERSEPTKPEDVYRAFVIWCETEKDVRVYFTDKNTRDLIEANLQKREELEIQKKKKGKAK